MKLAINLITRGRPEVLLPTLQETFARITSRDTIFMLSVDDDDAASIAALPSAERMARQYPFSFVTSVKPREDSVGAKWNRVLALDADVYLPMSDDAHVQTAGFDEAILDAAAAWPDGIGVVFNHLNPEGNVTGIQAATRRFTDIVGYLYPDLFPYSSFVDPWLNDIARMTDRFTFAEVTFRHDRSRRTMELRELSWWATFYEALYLKRRHVAHDMIRNHLCDPQWRKDILLRRHPLVEDAMVISCNNVRAFRFPEPPPDERYLRVKAKAVAMLKTMLPELALHHPPGDFLK